MREVDDLKAEKCFMQSLHAVISSQEVVILNVSGKMIYTTDGTLRASKSDILADLANKSTTRETDLDDKGNIFLDINPHCFKMILSRLRMIQLVEVLKSEKNKLQLPPFFIEPAYKQSFANMLQYYVIEASFFRYDLYESKIFPLQQQRAQFVEMISHYITDISKDLKPTVLCQGSRQGFQIDLLRRRSKMLSKRAILMQTETDVMGVCAITNTPGRDLNFIVYLRNAHLIQSKRIQLECWPFQWSNSTVAPEKNAWSLLEPYPAFIIADQCNTNTSSFCELTGSNISDRMSYHNSGHFPAFNKTYHFKVLEIEVWDLDGK
eukprot:758050-Hanusia_phi.AAC.1